MYMRSPAKANKVIFFVALWFLGSQFVLAPILLLLDMDSIIAVGIGQIVGFFVPFVFYLLITKQSPRQVLPWQGLSLKNALLIVAMSLAIMPALHIVSYLSSFIFVPAIAELDFDATPMWLAILIIGVFPSFFEEFWFRGVMFTGYRAGGVSILKTAIITGAFFGLIHMNFHQAIYAALIGLVYAYLVYYTRSILAPILGHFINNGLSAVLVYVDPYLVWYEGLLARPGMFLLVMGAASLVTLPIFMLCMKQFKKHYLATEVVENPAIEEPEAAVWADAEIVEPIIQAEAETEAAAEQTPAKMKVYTWGFWAALGLMVFFALIMEVVLRLSHLLL